MSFINQLSFTLNQKHLKLLFLPEVAFSCPPIEPSNFRLAGEAKTQSIAFQMNSCFLFFVFEICFVLFLEKVFPRQESKEEDHFIESQSNNVK